MRWLPLLLKKLPWNNDSSIKKARCKAGFFICQKMMGNPYLSKKVGRAMYMISSTDLGLWPPLHWV